MPAIRLPSALKLWDVCRCCLMADSDVPTTSSQLLILQVICKIWPCKSRRHESATACDMVRRWLPVLCFLWGGSIWGGSGWVVAGGSKGTNTTGGGRELPVLETLDASACQRKCRNVPLSPMVQCVSGGGHARRWGVVMRFVKGRGMMYAWPLKQEVVRVWYRVKEPCSGALSRGASRRFRHAHIVLVPRNFPCVTVLLFLVQGARS